MRGRSLLGAAAARWGHGEARRVVAEQRADRHRIRAEVTGRARDTRPSAQLGGQHTYRAAVRWSTPDGTERSTAARVPAGARDAETVDVWLDSRGRSVPPPSDDAAV